MKKKNIICKEPFNNIELFPNGEVALCCPGYTNNYFIGNIFETDSFEKIWNSDKAIKFRESIIDGSYKYCNTDFCWLNQNKNSTEYELIDPKLKQFPTKVTFCHDRQCNVRCITCRDKHITTDKETENHLNSLIEPMFLPMLKDAKIVSLNGSGELFASNHMQKLVKAITEKYPNIVFSIQSNGILFNEENCNKYGITNKIVFAKISVHAATKKTYEQIVRGGNFNKLLDNIKWLSAKQKANKLHPPILEFVITSINYKEMHQFVKLAKKLNCIPSFSTYRQWESELAKRYDEVAVFEPTHPEHKKFLKILNNKIFNSENCIMQNSLNDLRKQKTTFNLKEIIKISFLKH